MSVSAEFGIHLTVKNTLEVENRAGAVRAIFDAFERVRLVTGTADGEINAEVSDQRTLSASSNEDLDLAGGLADAFGALVTLAKVKLLVIHNESTTQTLTVKAAASNGWVAWSKGSTDGIAIAPGGFECFYAPAGLAVTAGTGDKLNVANPSGASCVYSIYAVGNT
jgi:hypothetical protein